MMMMMMMDGLMRSSSCKIVIDRYSLRVGGVNNYYKDCVERMFQTQISFSKCSRRLDSTSIKCRTVIPFTSATSDSHFQASETAVDREGQLSTVRVKFQLHKACVFGDHFLMVGDDPLLGSWDPESAITMEWSDGHMWTAQVDVPVEKTIQFKFILKQSTGDIIWQPGSDRVFKAWTTTRPIIVVEDWENSEMQKIVEDGIPGYDEELPLMTDVAENSTSRNDSSLRCSNIVVEQRSNAGKESSINMMVAHNIVTDHSRFSSTKGMEDDEVILSDPVLVPGLAPAMSNLTADESHLANENKTTDLNGSVSSQDSKNQAALESCSNSKAESEEVEPDSFSREKNLTVEKEEPDSGLKPEGLKVESDEEQKATVMPKREERNKLKFSDGVEFDNPYSREVKSRKDTLIHDVLIKDMHWSHTTLQNLLASLGFLVSAIRSIYH